MRSSQNKISDQRRYHASRTTSAAVAHEKNKEISQTLNGGRGRESDVHRDRIIGTLGHHQVCQEIRLQENYNRGCDSKTSLNLVSRGVDPSSLERSRKTLIKEGR